MIDACIAGLLRYAEDTGLIEADDRLWARNRLLEALQLDGCDPDCAPAELPLADLLRELTEDAVSRGVAQDNSVARDLFDTKLMGVLTPAPHEVRAKFRSLYAVSPEQATDWFYAFSQNTNYIRRDRIARDQKWVYESAYGPLDITINLSKPEKDPRAIAAAKLAPQSGYPKCALCAENEGYAGRMNHPARQNHRVIPVTINGSGWYLQYSPYVYYNEHCIVFNGTHTPMKIDRAAFRKLLDFVGQFPHYFVGSNADLPIVGGSILSHDHFQGGHYTFAMERAPVEEPVRFRGFDDIRAGIVKWPMSVLRLTGPDSDRLVELAVSCAHGAATRTRAPSSLPRRTASRTTPSHPLPAAAARTMSWTSSCAITSQRRSIRSACSTRMRPCTISKKRTSASSRSWALPFCPPV